jgi:hypothetical protein
MSLPPAPPNGPDDTPEQDDPLPTGLIFIETAVEQVSKRFPLPERRASERVVQALRDGEIEGWEHEPGPYWLRPDKHHKTAARFWDNAEIDMEEFRERGSGGLRYRDRDWHLHHCLIGDASFARWMDKVAPPDASTPPDPSSNLPPFLTLMQALAWVITRDPFVVLRASLSGDDHTAAEAALGDTSDWCGAGPGLTTPSLCLRAGREDAVGPAKAELVLALQRGEVIASAVRFSAENGSRREYMTRADWADLALNTVTEEPRTLVPFRQVNRPSGGFPDRSWKDVKIEADGLQRKWPGLQGTNGPAIGVPKKKGPGGKPRKYNWEPVLKKLRDDLVDEGAPAANDGGQAKYEKFVRDQFPPDNCPGESIVRVRVCETIKAFRDSLGALGSKAGN